LKAHFTRTLKTLIIILSALLLIAILLVSPWGTRLALSLAQNNVAGLEIEYGSGGLSSTLHLDRLAWKNDLTQVEVKALSVNLNWVCAMSLRLCLSELGAEKINVKNAANTQAETSSRPVDKLSLPIPVAIKSLELRNISIELVDTVKVEIGSVLGRLRMFQTLNIETLLTKGLKITLPKSEVVAAQNTLSLDIAGVASWQYHPADLPTFTLPLAMNAKRIEIKDLSVFEMQKELVVIDNIVTAMTLSPKKIKIGKLSVKHSQGDLSLSGELDAKLRHNISADLNLYQQADFTQPLHAKLVLQGTPDKLLIVISSKGELEMNAQLSADLSSKLLPLSGEVSWQDLAWPLTQPSITSTAGKITLQGDMNEYKLAIDTDVAGEGIPLTVISAKIKGNNKQLSVSPLNAKTLDGEISLKGDVKISDKLNWQGDLDFREIKPQFFLPQLIANLSGVLKHKFSYDGKNYQLEVTQITANGSWQDYELTANGNGQYDSREGLKIPDLAIKTGDNTVQLKALISPKQNIVATLELAASDLSQLYPTIGGQSIVNAKISGTIAEPAVEFTADGEDIRFEDISLSRFTSGGKLTWNDKKIVELNSQISNVAIAAQYFENIELSLKGQADQHTLNLAVQSGSNNFKTQISGQLDAKLNKWSGNWDKGLMGYSQGEFTLVGTSPDGSVEVPILADWQQGHYQIGANCWQSSKQESGKICVALADFIDNKVAFDVVATNLPVFAVLAEQLPMLNEVKTSSLLSFDLSGNWPLDGVPQVKMNAELSPSQWLLDKDEKPLYLRQFSFSARTETQRDSDQLNVLTSLKILADQLGEVNANINLHTTATTRDLSGEISLNNLQLHSLQPFVPQLETMEGDINARVDISGALEQPMLSGQVKLIEGLFAGNLLPANINHVNQTLTFTGYTATLAGPFQLGNGPGEIKGTLDWQDELRGSLQVSGDKMEIDYQNIVRAKFSPDLQIEFSPHLIKVAGEVTVPYARVRVRELPPSAISPSKDVVLINQQESESVETTALDLNVQLIIDPSRANEVKLDAFGLTSDLQGSLLLTQKSATLNANGDISLINGRYKAYGQNLLIRQGDIQFSGPIDNPFLTVEAVRDPLKTEDNVVAGIRVEGSTEMLDAAIFSEPVMEQKEALSYLLRGKRFNSEGGAANDAILASALIGFGLGQSESQINKVGQKLGLEDLALDASGDGEQTKLSVSGYIAPGVQLRYGIGVFDSASEVALRYQLSPKLYLEAVSGLNNALDIYYQFSRTSKKQSALIKKNINADSEKQTSQSN
jgi:translocation and assembly module TamB